MKHSEKNKELDKIIRKNIIEAIKQSGSSQTEIAKKIFITDSSLSGYIHKGKMPSLSTFARLCKALDVSADDILSLE